MVPEIQKIVLNMGLGLDGNDSKIIKDVISFSSEIFGSVLHLTN